MTNPDQELIDATVAIVRSGLTELVSELGVEGGPRVARVEGLLDSLLEREITDDQGNVVQGGHLGYLQHVFGLRRELVNTLEEEGAVTNYIVLRDYVTSLRGSWDEFRGTWLGRDLGTRLVLLSRALSVVAETVEEVYSAMNSVFVGATERQVASFRCEDGNSILVSELLSWVTTFATEEAPRLVHEGGRRGVAACIPTIQTLADLVSQFIQSIPYEPSLPDGLRHPRVSKPLRELQSYLLQALRFSQDVWRP